RFATPVASSHSSLRHTASRAIYSLSLHDALPICLLEVAHEPAHLDLLEDESLRTWRGLQVRDRGDLDLCLVPHERASLSTRRASTLIASRFGWSARTLST